MIPCSTRISNLQYNGETSQERQTPFIFLKRITTRTLTDQAKLKTSQWLEMVIKKKEEKKNPGSTPHTSVFTKADACVVVF